MPVCGAGAHADEFDAPAQAMLGRTESDPEGRAAATWRYTFHFGSDGCVRNRT
jgi:hypothetical protein